MTDNLPVYIYTLRALSPAFQRYSAFRGREMLLKGVWGQIGIWSVCESLWSRLRTKKQLLVQRCLASTVYVLCQHGRTRKGIWACVREWLAFAGLLLRIVLKLSPKKDYASPPRSRPSSKEWKHDALISKNASNPLCDLVVLFLVH